jgi:WhiB family transcriptional regulator, redox-sensing transcriptional regulator
MFNPRLFLMTGYFSRLRSPDLPKAACVDVDPEIFFADDQVNPDVDAIQQARTICASCEEQNRCLEWGLRNENYGMWGGLTANERRYYLYGKSYKLQHAKDLGII